jgi:hypothetical protein
VGDVRKPIGVLGSEGEGDKAQASRILGFCLLAPAAIGAILGYHSAGRPSAASINSLRNHCLSE